MKIIQFVFFWSICSLTSIDGNIFTNRRPGMASSDFIYGNAPLFGLWALRQIFAFPQTSISAVRQPQFVAEHVQLHVLNYKMPTQYRLLVKNASQVVVICSNGEKYLQKDAVQNLCVVDNGSVVIGWWVLNLLKLSRSDPPHCSTSAVFKI